MKTLALLLLTMQLPLLAEPAHATSYWIYRWSGITNTSAVAFEAHATMVATSVPTKPADAQVILWQLLGQVGLRNYVEAGIGWPALGDMCRDLRARNPDSAVCIWYAVKNTSGAVNQMRIVKVIPLGTAVDVSLTKIDGEKFVTLTFKWKAEGKNRIWTKVLDMGDWFYGAGIHPTQIEVDTNTLLNTVKNLPADSVPRNIHLQASNLLTWPGELSYLYTTHPAYFAAQGSTKGFSLDVD